MWKTRSRPMPEAPIASTILSPRTVWKARKFVAWIMANHPDAHGEIKRVFADGDYVILHSHWHGLSDKPRGEAVVDIFRWEDGKVVEHWDVIQPVPEKAANNNTMF